MQPLGQRIRRKVTTIKRAKNAFKSQKKSKLLAQNKKTSYLCIAIEKQSRLPPKIALWCNGSTSDSGSACESSNLSKATKKVAFLMRLFLLYVRPGECLWAHISHGSRYTYCSGCLVGKEEAAAATRDIRVLFIQEGIQGGGEVFADLIAESDGAVAVEDNNAGNAADTVGISGSGLAVYPYFPG